MKLYITIIFFIFCDFIISRYPSAKISLDSVFNIYKKGSTSSHLYKEIANTTWKEYFISEKIKNMKKIIPCQINNDKELDLFVLDKSEQLFWINNIRGTSKDFTHKKLSDNFIGDFVILNKYDIEDGKEDNNIYILATNQNRDRIIKYKKNPYYNPLITNDTLHNTKKYWEETIFLDIADSSLTSLIEITKFTKIKSLHIYKVKDSNYQILLLNLENLSTNKCNLIKIRIQEEKIISLDSIGNNLYSIKIVGIFDINNDGLMDILYVDERNILYVYLNQDPYYFSVEIYELSPTMIDNYPRIFVYDANKDLYPDIITGDIKKNTIALILNPGRNYWNKIIKYFHKKNPVDKGETYKDISWQYLPLIDSKSEELAYERLKDFTIIMIDKSKRISFEIVAIFGDKLYWFIEKENNKSGYSSPYSIYQHLIHSMKKCDIFVEKLDGGNSKNKYDIILDIDVNNDKYPEFILYSYKLKNMIYIQRQESIISQYGWSQAFWIYLMIGLYTVSTIIGGIEFYRLKKANDKFSSKVPLVNNEQNNSQELELGKVKDDNNNK
jgi:hypothetical protein